MLAACYPLFEEERVEAIEWSFDALHKVKQIPPWFTELLSVYGNEGRLLGHGIYFSLFSGRWLPEQQQWLDELRRLTNIFKFDHVSEHFGFLTGADFHHGAPLSIPYTATTLQIGRDRLARIYDACKCPVGLENLAFSYSVDEVKRHGEFLEKLIEPVNGFIILDLHNLYCQSHNFSIPGNELIAMHPLERVREIHISGGSWELSGIDTDRNIRRDTHDEAVPDEVFDLLSYAIDVCPQLKYVVLEQIGTALKTDDSRFQFQENFKRMQAIVQQKNTTRRQAVINSFLPISLPVLEAIAEDQNLYAQQTELSYILESATSFEDVLHRIQISSLSSSDWNIESWDPSMLETAMKIAQKWK